MSYPKWVYHRELPAKIVQHEQEHQALGGGWKESPVDHEQPELLIEEAPTDVPPSAPAPAVKPEKSRGRKEGR